jgi:hypothetical protein
MVSISLDIEFIVMCECDSLLCLVGFNLTLTFLWSLRQPGSEDAVPSRKSNAIGRFVPSLTFVQSADPHIAPANYAGKDSTEH